MTLFDSYFPYRFPLMLDTNISPSLQSKGRNGSYLRINMSSTDEALVVTAELPGVEKESIDVSFEGDYLNISGERTPETIHPHGDTTTTQYEEIVTGSYSRSVQIPPTVNKDAVTATYTNGMLQLTLPLKEEVKPKQIAIT